MHKAAWHRWENIYCERSERKIGLSNISSLVCSKQFKKCFTRGFDYCQWQGLGTALTQRVFIEADMFATGYLWPCWLLASHHKLENSHYLGKLFVDKCYAYIRYLCTDIEEHIEKVFHKCNWSVKWFHAQINNAGKLEGPSKVDQQKLLEV